MATRRTVLASALALGGAGLAGVPLVRARQATPAAADDDAILVPIELSEFEVESDQLVFRAGQAYRFDVRNDGKIVHEFVIEPFAAMDEPLEKDGQVSELEDIDPGAGSQLTWTFDAPGPYKMDCHIEGHYEAGMMLPIEVIDDAQVIEVQASEFVVELGQPSAQAGKPVAFVVRNVGKIPHEMVIEPRGAVDEPFELGDDDDDDARASEIEDIAPGTRRELIWTFQEPAMLDVACHIAGHYEAGMVAPFEITG